MGVGCVIINGRVVTPSRVIEQATVYIKDNLIVEVSPGKPEVLPENWRVIDAQNLYVAPGFIDLHVHGGGGADSMDGNELALDTISRTHARHGTTALLPTTLACEDEELFSFLELFHTAKNTASGAKLLGIHLEGPYINLAQKGALDPRFIKQPDSGHYREILRRSDDILRLSAAPELPGALAMARELRERGILLSIAHSDATFEQVVEATEAGFSHVTHLYSAMSSVRRIHAFRVAGVVEAALTLDELAVEIIADGVHLPAALLQMIMKVKGTDKTMLVTDAMRAAGMPDGDSILGSLRNGLAVIVEDGVAKLPDRTAFAGSVATADRLVRTMMKLAGVSLVDAVKMVTLTPARMLNMDNRLGRLAPGLAADIVLFDSDIQVKLTMVNGNVVYSNLPTVE